MGRVETWRWKHFLFYAEKIKMSSNMEAAYSADNIKIAPMISRFDCNRYLFLFKPMFVN